MQNKIYYIYHIPGVKIGCTDNVKKRMKQQNFTEWEILEEWDCEYKASDRELELQKEYGYTLDRIPYWRTLNLPKDINHLKSIASIGGKKGGKIGGKVTGQIHIKSGHLAKIRKERQKVVLMYDKVTNLFIKEFESAVEASKEINGDASTIHKVCKSKVKSHKGFIFKYKE